MFGLLSRLMDGLAVYPENMRKNLGLSLGMWNSQTVLLALIRKGLTREEAYALVQRNAMKTWEVKHAGRDDADFLEALKSDGDVARHFKKGELEKLSLQGSERPIQETGPRLVPHATRSEPDLNCQASGCYRAPSAFGDRSRSAGASCERSRRSPRNAERRSQWRFNPCTRLSASTIVFEIWLRMFVLA
jgi:hypothetical protein